MFCPMMGNGIPLSCAAICQKWIDQSFLTTGSKNPLRDFQKDVDFINGKQKIKLPLWYEVFCTNCNLQMSYLKTMDEAVECWNRRAKN